MRTASKWLLAFGLIGAAALSGPTVASAQGFYLNGPGFGFGVGTPYYGGYYGAPYAYGAPYHGYGRYWHPHRYRYWRRY